MVFVWFLFGFSKKSLCGKSAFFPKWMILHFHGRICDLPKVENISTQNVREHGKCNSNFGFVNIYKGNFYLPKLEKPYLHIWLTTYQKAEFHISKEGKMFTSTKGISICQSWKSHISIYG